MDNRDKKNRMSSTYDDDMDWLDDDDDYLDDGGLLGSLLFGDKKKKKKKNTDSRTVKKSSDREREEKAPADRPVRRRPEETSDRPVRRRPEETSDRPVRRRPEEASDRPARRRPEEASDRPVRRRPEETSDRPVRRRPEETSDRSEGRSSVENAAADVTERPQDRPARRRKISQDRTPVRIDDEEKRPVRPARKPATSVGTAGEYDEYYHENSSSARPRKASKQRNVIDGSDARRRIQESADEATSSSVDSLLKEVSSLEENSRRRHEELRREAWERTQRNVAKAKAEVERLEQEREQSEKEEARQKRVQEELERRQAEQLKTDQLNADQIADSVDQTGDVKENADSDIPVDDTADAVDESVDAGVHASDTDLSDNQAPDWQDNEAARNSNDEDSDSKDNSENSEVVSDTDDDEFDIHSSRTAGMLDMDELERIERDIDEDKLSYSESDTADLGLGDIGKALGFDAVELEDDEEVPDEDEESDSEKFFRENLLDEADPKVVNPERKKLNISTRVWAIAFFVLLVMFILICVIYVKNYARMKYNEMDINEISSDQILVNDGVKDATNGYRAIALYGVDSRDSNMSSGTNSDSIMIASINESTKEIKLVSVYRDTLMEIASGSMDTTHKVNYAYQLGGAVTAINTLNTNLDLNITDYVAVDFSAMASIIDAVGGVDVKVVDGEINNFNKNLAEQISLSGKYSSGITQAGEYTLDGQQAVAYSRIRSTDNGDITRTERQRIVLMKVIEKLLSADTGSLDSFVDVSFKCISTSLNKDDIHALVKDVAGYKVVDTVGFPFAYEAKDITDKGSCLVAADLASNVEALHEYLYGTDKYVISGTVKQISSDIESVSGVKAQKVKITTEAPGDGISDGSDEDGDLRTITTPPKGMIVEE